MESSAEYMELLILLASDPNKSGCRKAGWGMDDCFHVNDIDGMETVDHGRCLKRTQVSMNFNTK